MKTSMTQSKFCNPPSSIILRYDKGKSFATIIALERYRQKLQEFKEKRDNLKNVAYAEIKSIEDHN